MATSSIGGIGTGVKERKAYANLAKEGEIVKFTDQSPIMILKWRGVVVIPPVQNEI
jgi:hypothetical protein